MIQLLRACIKAAEQWPLELRDRTLQTQYSSTIWPRLPAVFTSLPS